MTTTPSPSLPQQDPQYHTQNQPNSTNQDDQNQTHQQPQSPQTLTLLDSSDPPNPDQSQPNQTQNQQEEEDREDPPALVQKEDLEKTGMSSLSPRPPPALIIPPVRDPDPNPIPLTSPTSLSRRPTKRKKVGHKKLKAIEEKIHTLTQNLKPIPFLPPKNLNFDKHEKLLRRLGLWDFVHTEFDRDIRVDLVAQLIATYDRESRASYVNELRILVNRADLARAFKLPVKKERGNVSALSSEVVDLDSEELVTGESIAFIEEFVSNWVLLHEDTWMMPEEVLNWTRAIRDGHPEAVNWAGVIWFMVERELMQGKQLEECYYASHMQYLMKSQREELFREGNRVEVKEEEDVDEVEMGQEVKVETVVEVKDEEDGGEGEMGQEVKVETVVEVKVETVVEVKDEEDGGEGEMGKEPVLEVGVEVREGEDGGVETGKEPMVEAGVEAKEEEEDVGEAKMGKEPMVEAGVEAKEEEEDGGEVKMGKEPMVEAVVEAEEEEEEDGGGVKTAKEPMVEAVVEEEEEEEEGGVMKMGGFNEFKGQVTGDNVTVGQVNVELTLGKEVVEMEEEDDEVKDGDMMDVEESEEEEQGQWHEEEEQGQWLLDGKNSMGDHFLQRCDLKADTCMDGDEERKPEEEEEEDEEGDEEEDEAEDDGFNLMSRGNTVEGDMLTGNLLQGLQTTQMPFGLTGQLRGQSDMELLASRTEPHMTSAGPSFFGNGSKRELVHEDDISHESLNGNSKRLRTDGTWSHKPSDFDMCMEEMQHWMGKARMMYQAKEQASEESNMNQQFLLSELQRRDDVIEHLHKTNREELQKKDGEIYRLERDLYLMGNLLEGYRKAVKETHKAFAEYRQRSQLPEEPLYKDAGPGGLVLSTMELEKQRLKREEEERVNRLVIEQKVKEFEEEVFGKMEAHFDKVQMLDKRLVDSENEVKLLKELSAKPKVSEASECAPPEGSTTQKSDVVNM